MLARWALGVTAAHMGTKVQADGLLAAEGRRGANGFAAVAFDEAVSKELNERARHYIAFAFFLRAEGCAAAARESKRSSSEHCVSERPS